MIVVDTSVIVAMLFGEPERAAFTRILDRFDTVMSAATFVECVRVVGRRTPRLRPRLRPLIDATGTALMAFDDPQSRLADEGHRRFGIGRGTPPAVLNFGDLFAYALARHLDAPLLFKGDDFRQTDVRVAQY